MSSKPDPPEAGPGAMLGAVPEAAPEDTPGVAPDPAPDPAPDAAPDSSPDSSPDPAPVAVRAQLLATEHWSLLATRGMTWSEIMSRITIHLTVTSAALVVLALVAQASGYGTTFRILAIGLASAVLVLGTLTGLRVMNASNDDAALVIGMNRLRAAYVEIDPQLSRWLVSSPHDDLSGLDHTYSLGLPRSTVAHVLASTAMFVNVVNAIVAGTLAALIADTAGARTLWVSLVGVAAGLAYLTGSLEVGRRMVSQLRLESRSPTPPE